MEDKLKVEDLVYLSYRRTRNSLRLLTEYVNGSVLDVGSGRGHNLIRIANLGSTLVVGNDIVIDQELKTKLQKPKVCFVQSDCTQLPFNDQSIDLAFAHHVIEHITRVDLALREIFRVLKKDGKAIICVPTVSSKSLYLYMPAGQVALMLSSVMGRSYDSPIGSMLEGRNRPSLVLGENADSGINTLELILGKLSSPFLVKVLYSWAAILYFAVQNHIEHTHKMLNFRWKRLFEEIGFRVEKICLCGIFPHWLSNALPKRYYYTLDRIENRLNGISFFQKYVSRDPFYVLEK